MKIKRFKLITLILALVLAVSNVPVDVFRGGHYEVYADELNEVSGNGSVSDPEAVSEDKTESPEENLPGSVSSGETEELPAGEENTSGDGPFYVDISDKLIINGAILSPDDFESGGEESAGSTADYDGAKAALVSAFDRWNGESSITVDLTRYCIPITNSNFIKGIMNSHPEFFYLAGEYYYSHENDNFTTVRFIINNSYTVSTRQEFADAANEILSGVKGEWTPLQKALYIHDHIVTHTDYYFVGGSPGDKHNAYNVLVEHKAVCSGYAQAYEYLMNRIDPGFECDYISSSQMDHAWNLITIGGKKYYVDCTWDDFAEASYKYPENLCKHKNFLRSRNLLKSECKHTSSDWVDSKGTNVYTTVPGGTEYDTAPWLDCNSLIPMTGNIGAYATGYNTASLYRYDFNTGSSTKLTDYSATWKVLESGASYSANFSSLGIVGQYFVVSTPETVFVINKNGGSPQTKYTLTDSEKSKGYIYSAVVSGNMLTYQLYPDLKTRSGIPAATGTVDLSEYNTPVASVTLNKTSLSLNKGESALLTATVLPSNSTEKEVTWRSSNASVAKVSSSGMVTAVGEGTANITASCGGVTSDICRVKVIVIHVESVDLSSSSMYLRIGEKERLTAAVLPQNATEKTVTWESSNESVAEVDRNGIVKGVDYGTAYISAACDGVRSSYCTVTVYRPDDPRTGNFVVDYDYTGPGFFKWTGEMITPHPVVRSIQNHDIILTEGIDYSLSYGDGTHDNRSMGINTGVVMVKGLGDYSGKMALSTFSIKKSLSDNIAADRSVELKIKDPKYDERGDITANVSLYDRTMGKALIQDVDYSLSFREIKDSDKAYAIITGIGDLYYDTYLSPAFVIGEDDGSLSENFEEKVFTVSFYSDDTVYDIQTVKGGDTAVRPSEDPQKNGYVFHGWKKGNSLWNFSMPVTDDIKLRAWFTKNTVSGNSGNERTGSGKDPVAISTSDNRIYLVKGQKYSVFGTGFVSTDDSIASYDSKTGKITAKGAGEAIISNSTDSYRVTVVKPSFNAKNRNKTLVVGKAAKLVLSGIDKKTAYHYPVTWESSNETVAMVNDGTVFAVGRGKAEIYAYVGGKRYRSQITVRDVCINSKKVSSNGIIEINPLDTLQLKYSRRVFIPQKAVWTGTGDNELTPVTGKKGKPSGYQNDVIRIYADGKVKAVGPGQTTVTGVDKNKREVTLTVKVRPVPAKNSLYLLKGRSAQLSFRNVNNRKADWSVDGGSASQNNVISVDKTGNVTGLKTGSAVINCVYNGFTFTTKVFVEDPALSFDDRLIMDENICRLFLKKGQIYCFNIKNMYRTPVYKAGNTKITFVDENGTVYARDTGRTNISVKLNNKIINIKVLVME